MLFGYLPITNRLPVCVTLEESKSLPMVKAMHLMKWTDRQFHFGCSNDFIPFLLERLSATAPRIEELICYSKDPDLSYNPSGKWSVKEQIGHLIDLEELHSGRLTDFQNRLETLR